MKVLVCKKMTLPDGRIALVDPEIVNAIGEYEAKHITYSDVAISDDECDVEYIYHKWVHK